MTALYPALVFFGAMQTRRVIVAVTGATGAVYARRLLEQLREREDIEAHLIVSKAGALTIASELPEDARDFDELADVVHSWRNIGASIASGSFQTAAMIIAPCSMNTLASVAGGLADNLITRAADVCLKERRKLVLLTREAPLSLVHLRNMSAVTEAGGIVFPPVAAFYAGLSSLDDMVDQTVARVLDLVEIETEIVRRWCGVAGK
jgi:polyprenyl P-hydroxybenzoate/phenylacrylic acid decarboxylase-like protein